MELLKTKLFIPAPKQTLVPRSRLVERLNSARQHKLTLLSAPAGFGKTTLLSEWVLQAGIPTAWLSLDRADDEDNRFWSYFIAALQTIHPSIGANSFAALQLPNCPPIQAILTALINELASIHSASILILDDYHTIQSQSIHQDLNFLIDRLPQTLCLIIATREDPPLSLSKRRGLMEMAELRAVDLRFTRSEIDHFLNSNADLALSGEDITALESRTEGWPVGLHLAALSLRTLDDAGKRKFLAAFSGNDRYIMDYLIEEVLQRQPAEIHTFLLQTSFLDRLSAPLCDAVTGRQDGQELLDELERTNLFTISLDNQRCWYRYHQFFADLLRRRLDRSTTPAETQLLIKRASVWFEQEGLIEQSVSYAFLTKDPEFAADLIEKHVLFIFYRSETLLVHNWLKSLPPAVLYTHPLLCAVYASTIMLFSSASIKTPETLALIESWLQRAEASLAVNVPADSKRVHSLTVHYINKVRAFLARLREEDTQRVIELTLNALQRLPPDELLFRSALNLNLAFAYRQSGNFQAANFAMRQAVEAGIASRDLFNLSAAWFGVASLARTAGRLHEAARICIEGLQCTTDLAGGKPVPFLGVIHVLLGSIRLDWGELKAAEHALKQGLAMLELTVCSEIQCQAQIDLAVISQAAGKLEEATQWLDCAAAILPERAENINAVRARLWLKQADQASLDAACQWAQGRRLETVAVGFQPDPEQISLAYTLLAAAQRDPGLRPSIHAQLVQFLPGQFDRARQLEITAWEIEIFILQALTHLLTTDTTQALNSLRNALQMAEPEGYVRPFIKPVAPLQELLQKASTRGAGAPYAARLLSKLNLAPVNNLEPISRPTANLEMVEPLSAREVEIMHLIAAGVTNQEIASDLCISIHTVKTHINHIFAKLGVSTRTQSVARARQLGILG